MGVIAKIFREKGIVSTTPPPVTRAWNPGHYIRTAGGNNNAPTDWPSLITNGVQGFLKPYNWRVMEPNQDSYDGLAPVTGIVAKDLQFCYDNGVRLVLMMVDRAFTGGNPAPNYFGTPAKLGSPNDNIYVQQYSSAITSVGYLMARWNKADKFGDPNGLNVRTRLKLLIDAIADLCDGHPAFEGLYFQETAMGYDDAQKAATNYSPQNYADYYIDILNYAATKMPASRIFWCLNYIPKLVGGGKANEYADQVLAGVEASHAVAFGGPDALVEDTASLGAIEFSYMGSATHVINGVTCDGYKNRIPSTIQVSPPCYGIKWNKDPVPARYWTMQELYDWMKNTDSHNVNSLFASYAFWYALNGSGLSADTDLGAPYNGYLGGAGVLTPSGKTIVANNHLLFNYTGPK